jgi:hypothetical protein
MSDTELTLDIATSPQGIILLGSITLKKLQEQNACCFYLNHNSVIELIDPIDLAMDTLPEDNAIRVLSFELKHTDDQILGYLRGRAARKVGKQTHE